MILAAGLLVQTAGCAGKNTDTSSEQTQAEGAEETAESQEAEDGEQEAESTETERGGAV